MKIKTHLKHTIKNNYHSSNIFDNNKNDNNKNNNTNSYEKSDNNEYEIYIELTGKYFNYSKL